MTRGAPLLQAGARSGRCCSSCKALRSRAPLSPHAWRSARVPAVAGTKVGGDGIDAAREALRALGEETSAGARCSAGQRKAALAAVAVLEREGSKAAVPPATSPLLEGAWQVVWTDAPPPSNGALGPVRTARLHAQCTKL